MEGDSPPLRPGPPMWPISSKRRAIQNRDAFVRAVRERPRQHDIMCCIQTSVPVLKFFARLVGRTPPDEHVWILADAVPRHDVVPFASDCLCNVSTR